MWDEDDDVDDVDDVDDDDMEAVEDDVKMGLGLDIYPFPSGRRLRSYSLLAPA